MKRTTTALMVVFLAAVVSGCGDTTEETTTTTTTTTTPPSTPATTSTSPPPETSTTTTTTSAPGITTTTEPGELPGEPIDFGPAEGDVVAVIGVAHDDVLNLREAPGADQEIVDEIPPLEDRLVALGETRDIGESFWIAVDYEGTRGWVHLGFIGYPGDTTDETAAVVDDLGETPTADTMEELGLLVAESLASEEPASDITLTVEPTVGDLGEVTYDVIGLGDDAVRGLRVHVFGEEVDGEFSLRSVEMTTLCGRGVTADGLCI